MIKIFEMYGGSRAYRLDTPQFDIDIRYVFLNTEKSRIIGLDRYEHQDIKSATEDSFGYELRHFLNLLRKTNTQVLELLFSQEYISISPGWSHIVSHKYHLLDSERFFKSLMGYIQGERKLCLGERTGQLGGKRKAALDQWGYSPKNAVQLLRLIFAGRVFFLQGFFPVDISQYPLIHSKLMDIKLNPDKFNPQEILQNSLEQEELMKRAFNDRAYDYKFNLELANDLCCDLYKPLL